MTAQRRNIENAFGAAKALGCYLRNAEFYLGFHPEKPPLGPIDMESVRTHLGDVRGALSVLALALADMAAEESSIATLEEMVSHVTEEWE